MATIAATEVEDAYALSQISPLSDGQELALSTVTLLSACLSVVGSASIIFKVVANRDELSPYNRIMLGLSITDILASCSYALGPFLVPSNTSQRVWAVGSNVSCSFLGWLTQLSLSAVWYNALLSFYYLLTVRFGISRHEFARRYEKYLHGLTWLFFISTATLGSTLDLYEEMDISQGCWVGEIPKGCEAAGTCTGKGQIVGWFFGGIWVAFTFVALVVNNILVYSHVRKELKLKSVLMAMETTSMEEGHSSFLSTGSGGTGSFPAILPESLEPEVAERALRNQAHIREVASQGFLYVGCFFITFTPAFVLGILDSIGFGPSDEGDLYPLMLVGALFVPLQGYAITHSRLSHGFGSFVPSHPLLVLPGSSI